MKLLLTFGFIANYYYDVVSISSFPTKNRSPRKNISLPFIDHCMFSGLGEECRARPTPNAPGEPSNRFAEKFKRTNSNKFEGSSCIETVTGSESQKTMNNRESTTQSTRRFGYLTYTLSCWRKYFTSCLQFLILAYPK
jgi:hypothetical protein